MNYDVESSYSRSCDSLQFDTEGGGGNYRRRNDLHHEERRTEGSVTGKSNRKLEPSLEQEAWRGGEKACKVPSLQTGSPLKATTSRYAPSIRVAPLSCRLSIIFLRVFNEITVIQVFSLLQCFAGWRNK